jgi:hypothetical protein
MRDHPPRARAQSRGPIVDPILAESGESYEPSFGRRTGGIGTVQRRPLVLICAPYSGRLEARRAIQVALRAEASAGRSE